jgi:putative membrane protein
VSPERRVPTVAFLGPPLTIKNFTDHAANERTFLAWVRTAVAMMGFGFVIERFDLFLRATPIVLAAQTTTSHNLRLGELAGLAVMVAGLAMLLIALARFVRTSREIDDTQEHKGPGERFDIALAGMLFIVGAALFGYLVFNLFVR